MGCTTAVVMLWERATADCMLLLTKGGHTRHTTSPHRRHSPTMSLAHFPTPPLCIRPGPINETPEPRSFHASRDWRIRSARRGPRGNASFEHRNVCLTSWSRYCRRFARNWRHVRARSWRELRSSRAASCEMILRQLRISDEIDGRCAPITYG